MQADVEVVSKPAPARILLRPRQTFERAGAGSPAQHSARGACATRHRGVTRPSAGSSYRSTCRTCRQSATPPRSGRATALGARFNGIDLDLDDTYAWGWHELHRLEQAMAQVAERILPGASLDEVVEHLEHDPTRTIEGVDEFRGWLQALLDRTVTELDGVHFDIPEPVKTVEAMISPPGGAAAMYYTGPVEDFSRPAAPWYPTLAHTSFPLGRARLPHRLPRGRPGHHLQSRQVVYLAGQPAATRHARRLVGDARDGRWTPNGSWASSATSTTRCRARHCRGAQAMRGGVVVATSCSHLESAIPDDDVAPGERWTPDLARAVDDRPLQVRRRVRHRRGRPLSPGGRSKRSLQGRRAGLRGAQMRDAVAARAPTAGPFTPAWSISGPWDSGSSNVSSPCGSSRDGPKRCRVGATRR